MSTNALNELRAIAPELNNLKIKNITLSKSGRAVFDLICDKAVQSDTKSLILRKIRSLIPTFFVDVVVNITKIVADGELVSKEIIAYLSSAHMSVAHSVKLEDVSFINVGGIGEYTLSLDSDIYGYFDGNDVLTDVSEHLEECFCGKFKGRIKDTGKTRSDASILQDKVNSADFETIKCRSFAVGDVVRLWGEEIDGRAIYIADAELVNGNVTFAGKIVAINQKETKKGKPFYILEIDDSTGIISGKVFMTKEKERKMEKINVGSQIITRGELSSFNGMPSYIIDDLSYCELPVDFKPEERESKSVPSEYSTVFPEPIVEVTQSFLFSAEKSVEPCMIGKTFVVLDIETTGVHYTEGDKITEIGAVRIVDGKIVDKFQTLVNPGVKISQEITNLTGIDDEMVKDAPSFDKVVPDLFKYVDGAYIVAHNIEFDYKFIKFMSKETGYVFKNEGIDTLAFSREVLKGMKNYKLNTVCGYFGIEFLHHRALSDAHATAKLLLELVAIKKSLPI
ncbi:MAG: 3'-5' exoribonuclease [Clostridia bacterium]|nr:3'-5' exoribonuclease [Clostridia bacterium]